MLSRLLGARALGACLAILGPVTVVPAQPAPGPVGTIVVTNKAPATATIIDLATGRILATLPTGNGPHEIVLTRDGRTAVVSDYGTGPAPGSTLTILDVPSKRIVRTMSLGEYTRPHGLVLLPGDSIVAVTSEATRNLVLVHITRAEIVRVIATTQDRSHMVGVTADGKRGWTGNIGSNSITELDLERGTSLRTIAVPAQPEAINVTPNGSEVWVGSNATGDVSVVNTRTGEVRTAASGFGWPYRVAFTPDTATVLLPDLRNEALRIVDRKTFAEQVRLPLAGTGPQGIVITPDGRYAFLSFSKLAKVAVLDLRTRAVIREIDAGLTPDGVAYTTRVWPP
jgi:DNA-binding beta-propeller fold protein YncE